MDFCQYGTVPRHSGLLRLTNHQALQTRETSYYNFTKLISYIEVVNIPLINVSGNYGHVNGSLKFT